MSATHSVAQHHQNRWMVPLAAVTAVAMLVTWFPFSTLWHQQHALDATAAQIAALQRQERQLAAASKTISSTATATRLAREQYQLVEPGQSLIQVLPGSLANEATGGSGDPGLQPLVSPSSVSSLVPGTHANASRHSSMRGFLSRLVRTLEFWH